MSLPGYDFTDAQIRTMVQENHYPTEQVISGPEATQVTVICQVTHTPWPCPQITGLREWQALNP